MKDMGETPMIRINSQAHCGPGTADKGRRQIMSVKSVKQWTLGAVASLSIAGCTVGPDYKQPRPQMPGKYSATQPATQVPAQVVSLERWWESFNDPVLDSLVGRALRSNLDLRLAQSRVR